MDTMRGIKCFLLFLGLHIVAADFAQYEEYLNQQANNETFVRLFEEHVKLFEDTGKLKASDEFHCKPFLRTHVASPQTVHKLTPFDINVIGAVGDSITAGTGIKAKTVVGLLKQDRGSSWSVGGDGTVSGVETVPNILKVYNSKITGYSERWGPVWYKPSSHLNVAHPGDKSEDMPGQAVELVERMKCDKKIDFENDWKMITMFVGGNDLCDYCEDKKKYSAENYVANIQKALDYFHDNVPRAYVNLVEVLNVAMVKTLNANLICKALHFFLCDCAAFPKSAEAELELLYETQRYRDLTKQLVLSGRYDTRDDFTVVLQPFFTETVPPVKDGTNEPDLSYFAPDCFHLSAKGHKAAADALWNNMIEPVGKKRVMWTPEEKVECPTASTPYFYTYKNSGSSNSSSSVQQTYGLGAEQSDSLSKPQTNTGSDSTATTVTVLLVVGAIVATLAVGFVVYRRKQRLGQRNLNILVWPRKKEYSAI